MSKKGMIVAAVVVVALIGAGAGYFFLSASEVDVKDSFAKGDKHVMKMEGYSHYKIEKISEDGLTFEVDTSYGKEDFTYIDLQSLVEDYLVDDDEFTDAEKSEERIDTDFGKRDCIVYTFEEDEITEKYYVGKNNNVVYKYVYEAEDGNMMAELKKSSMIIESPDEFKLKDAKDLKVGDTFNEFNSAEYTMLEIIKVISASDDDPVMYEVESSMFSISDTMSYKEILELLTIDEDELEEAEHEGTENIQTPFGKIKCDVYLVDDDGEESKVWVSNNIPLKAESKDMSMHISHSDFIVKK